MSSLGKIFGRGAMTNHWNDLENSDLIVTCGANNAENHPLSMKHIDHARSRHGAKYIVIDPRFTRTAAVADLYSPIRSGTNTVFFGAVINYLIQNNLYQEDYVKNWTTAPFLVNEDFGFDEGLFTGYDPETRKYNKETWTYQYEEDTPADKLAATANITNAADSRPETNTMQGAAMKPEEAAAAEKAKEALPNIPKGFEWVNEPGVPTFQPPVERKIKQDPTMQDPHCVFQLIKKHYERYTPEMVENICGMTKETFLQIAQMIGETGAPDKSSTYLYAMGLTQHSTGSQMIKCLAMMQILLGNIGVCGGGVDALRGESNVQGSTDMGLLFDQFTAYSTLAVAKTQPTLRKYLEQTTAASGYYTNRPKFIISTLKEMYGEHATVDNDYCFDYLPKMDGKDHSYMTIIQNLYNGDDDIRMCIAAGQNPIVGMPNVNVVNEALKKLEMLVCADLWETETSVFWKRPGNDPSEIDTEVFLLPMASSFEKQGTVTNSGRMAQWRCKAVEPAGDCIDDGEMYTHLLHAVQDAYREEPGQYDEPIMNLKWDYLDDEGKFDSRKAAMGINGYNTETGELLPGFGSLKADGSTACGAWIYSGYYCNNDAKDDPSLQPCGRRVTADVGYEGGKGGLNQYLEWSWVWPLNRHILYNRASADKNGKPYNPKFPLVEWNEETQKWITNDVPDFGYKNADGTHKRPEKTVAFMMNSEQRAALFTTGTNEGPLPEHYEPFESVQKNYLSKVQNNPVANVYADINKIASSDEFPLICTTYRMSEHWQAGAMTRNIPWLAECQPKVFVEISEELATARHIKNGELVEVFNHRGSIKVPAMVTKRMKAFNLASGKHEIIGIPWNWGFASMCSRGESANELSPFYGDPNSKIPEYKAFLVDIRKVGDK